MFEFASANVD